MNQLDGSISYNSSSPLLQYDVTAFLDTLPVYNQSAQRDADLELSRDIVESNNYYYYGFPFPNAPDPTVGITNFAALETKTGSISLPPYSYLVNVTYFIQPKNGFTKQFRIRIYDKGAKTDLFYNRFAQSDSVLGTMPNINQVNVNKNSSSAALTIPGPMQLTSPMVVLPPGNLQIEMTNLNDTTMLMQVLFNFAVPLNKTSTNVNKVGS